MDKFNLYEVYEQNLNFLFGAGASYGFLPTLALNLKGSSGQSYTFETLAKELDSYNSKNLYALLFMHYFRKCISPGLPRLPKVPLPPHRAMVLNEYSFFLKTLISVLAKKKPSENRCNIYTTNYDNCFELASDSVMLLGDSNFAINDGSSGFQSRKFHTKNYNNRIIQRGIFDKHAEYIPQINILHPHGSVYWQKSDTGIDVNYGNTCYDITFNSDQEILLSEFESLVDDKNKNLDDLLAFGSNELQDWSLLQADSFWEKYNRIPIVNPTKWKFHETVFEEAYYQILRHLSFELERPHSVLVTFGFSFADEHILHLVQRSLSNPTLTLYVSCYNEIEKKGMQEKFKGYANVKYITIDDDLIFSRFNKRVFTLNKERN